MFDMTIQQRLERDAQASGAVVALGRSGRVAPTDVPSAALSAPAPEPEPEPKIEPAPFEEEFPDDDEAYPPDEPAVEPGGGP